LREGVFFLEIYWQLVPQERGLITEGSASHSTFRNWETQVNLQFESEVLFWENM